MLYNIKYGDLKLSFLLIRVGEDGLSLKDYGVVWIGFRLIIVFSHCKAYE